MKLHPLAARFATVAASYERGRPEYPPAVIGALAAELALAPGDPVADVAAGTGKLTRALLAAGLDVVGIEPPRCARCSPNASGPSGRATASPSRCRSPTPPSAR